MLDSLFTGWGAFWTTMFMFAPFMLMGYYIIRRKSVIDPGPSGTPRSELSRLEGIWLTVVFVFFVGINLASLKFIPMIAAANAAVSNKPIQEVEVIAKSWMFEISKREIEVDQPVRFSGRAMDTQHGFAVYHPDGRMLFTMLMMPNTSKPTTVVHTFTQPGTYKVRCLEYCGVGHHAMLNDLVVVKSR